MIGRVVSNKTEKTVTILVESRKTHPLYKKSFAWSKKYLVHDEMGAQMGDVVEVEKCRPISKRKHWRVVKIVGRDIVPMNTEALKEISQEHIEEVMPEESEDREQMTEDSSQKTEDGKTEVVEAEVKAEKPKAKRAKKEDK